jgi:hypothetical protein
MKTVCHSDSFHLDKSVVCGGETGKPSYGSKLKDTVTQSIRIYARNQLNISKVLYLIKHARPNNRPKSQLFLTTLKKQAMTPKSRQKKRLDHIQLLGQSFCQHAVKL